MPVLTNPADKAVRYPSKKPVQFLVIGLIVFLQCLFSCSGINPEKKLDVKFDGGYGQLEFGGKYAGAEFHHSRPLPSRISFYYPVANSIVSSADYWNRDKSVPFTLVLKSSSRTDTLDQMSCPYEAAPFSAVFKQTAGSFEITHSYSVCDDLPVLVWQAEILNNTDKSADLLLESSMLAVLRTSHTFSLKDKPLIKYSRGRLTGTAFFAEQETDSALLFITNAGYAPDSVQKIIPKETGPRIGFYYKHHLGPDQKMEIVQIIGQCRQHESEEMISSSRRRWKESAAANRERILRSVYEQASFKINDPVLMQTLHWSKALLESNVHYINGSFMPMPCPAEYNFFFTHDLLVTSLGAMLYDPDYVKRGFQFLHSLTKDDSILAHAYYWKDTDYKTEFCGTDNWNNMWINIAAASYLKHSADTAVVRMLFPIMKKSMQMLMQSKGEDDLMYTGRPDWWDIGHMKGARVYNTTLMVKALQDYVYIAMVLNKQDEPLAEYSRLEEQMNKQLVSAFWDDSSGYLMNMIDEQQKDPHYYSGSLVAVFYDLLDQDKKSKLLETAKKVLLDENIGIRNAMSPDFHRLINVYKFNGMEAGEPYFYFNGAVWPQGNIWYILGLLADGRPAEAEAVLKKYMTLEGIRNSPNGQPSFYECRITDPGSDRYGEIDKPSFLWAGGWYIYALYHLAGVRENSWNIYLCPDLPENFKDIEYDLTLHGQLCHVQYQGDKSFFKEIIVDDVRKNTAVLNGPARKIILIRGLPSEPYLASADCVIEKVIYNKTDKLLAVNLNGVEGRFIQIDLVSPFKIHKSLVNGVDDKTDMLEKNDNGVYLYSIKTRQAAGKSHIKVYFN